MTNRNNDISFAITGYDGIFPDAKNPEKFWDKILLSQPAPLTSLGKRWDVAHEYYYDPHPGTPDKIYLDKAFCLEEKDIDLNNYQVNFGKKIVKDLFENIGKEHSLPDLNDTGIVIAATGTDAGYYNLDEEIIFNKKKIDLNHKGNVNSVDNQLKIIAEMAGLGGPQIAVDTACASSIYGIDLAMKIIKQARHLPWLFLV